MNCLNRAFSDLSDDQIFKYQKAFGYTSEDVENIIAPMATDGKEPIGSWVWIRHSAAVERSATASELLL